MAINIYRLDSTMKYTSWGNYFKFSPKAIITPEWRDDIALAQEQPMLAYGKGRSYGDSCLLDQGIVIVTDRLNRFIHFDKTTGLLRCEAGITLADILQLVTKYGWTLPVVPGTKYITLGGAVANDVHGKNHHVTGTFGCHVTQLELMRSTGERLICSANTHSDFFAATIGGLGLTGLITWVEVQLKRVPGNYLNVETHCFESLEDFFHINAESEHQYEYTVAWLDCQANKKGFGRGIYMRGNYVTHADSYQMKKRLSIPCYFPNFALNSLSIKLFNQLYYTKAKLAPKQAIVHYEPFFFPLDSINHWNRIYGKRGFFQYQCVIPNTYSAKGIQQLLRAIVESGQGSFLSVLKTFGNISSPGILSFPQPGVTLALDFANQGQKTLKLFDELDKIILYYGGRIYPAKDARMNNHVFQSTYPQWTEFKKFIDPLFSSNLWQRISKE